MRASETGQSLHFDLTICMDGGLSLTLRLFESEVRIMQNKVKKRGLQFLPRKKCLAGVYIYIYTLTEKGIYHFVLSFTMY